VPQIIREPPAGDKQGVDNDKHSDSIPLRPFAAALAAKGRFVFDEASSAVALRRSSLHSRIFSIQDRWSETADDDKLLWNQRPPLLMTGAPTDGSVGLVEPDRLAEYYPLGLDGILLNDVALGVKVARAHQR
jgi:hypothetical protein